MQFSPEKEGKEGVLPDTIATTIAERPTEAIKPSLMVSAWRAVLECQVKGIEPVRRQSWKKPRRTSGPGALE